jgi:hypothetical protein
MLFGSARSTQYPQETCTPSPVKSGSQAGTTMAAFSAKGSVSLQLGTD